MESHYKAFEVSTSTPEDIKKLSTMLDTITASSTKAVAIEFYRMYFLKQPRSVLTLKDGNTNEPSIKLCFGCAFSLRNLTKIRELMPSTQWAAEKVGHVQYLTAFPFAYSIIPKEKLLASLQSIPLTPYPSNSNVIDDLMEVYLNYGFVFS